MNPYFPGPYRRGGGRRPIGTPDGLAKPTNESRSLGFDRTDIRLVVGMVGAVAGTVLLAADKVSIQQGTALEWANKAVETAIVVASARLAFQECLAVAKL